jgi:predicted transposase YbfD/YdcC
LTNLSGIKTKDWAGLQCFIQVHRRIRWKGKTTEETAYFISSSPGTTSAEVFAAGVRGHWSIENSLHYTKDVTFKEDASKVRTGQAPENASLIRNIAINLFRMAGYTNMAQAIRLLGHDVEKLWGVVVA